MRGRVSFPDGIVGLQVGGEPSEEAPPGQPGDGAASSSGFRLQEVLPPPEVKAPSVFFGLSGCVALEGRGESQSRI